MNILLNIPLAASSSLHAVGKKSLNIIQKEEYNGFKFCTQNTCLKVLIDSPYTLFSKCLICHYTRVSLS